MGLFILKINKILIDKLLKICYWFIKILAEIMTIYY
jgi:hypothetical protein